MKILVCGDRNWNNKKYLFQVMDKIHAEFKITTIIHGGAAGADSLAGVWAKERGIKVEVFKADWKQFGKGAGPIRNREMLYKGKPERVVAFHNKIQFSKGTKNMLEQANKTKVVTRLYVEP